MKIEMGIVTNTYSSKMRQGFTIVELLIVIVVIAILAAISIVAYNGVQNRAQASAVQNDLTGIKKKLLLYRVDHDRYPSSTAELIDAKISATKAAYDTTGFNLYYCYNTSSDQFALTGRTASAKWTYSISSMYELKTTNNGSAANCQSIGLEDGYDDPAAFAPNGYNFTSSAWASWVK